ncbi:MAG: ATPase, T2SS/T4P/T4SS family [archaeon]
MTNLLEVKGKELEDCFSHTVFEGFPYNFYDLKKPKFSDLELRLIQYLKKALLGQTITESKSVLTEGFPSSFFIDLKKELNEIEIIPDSIKGFPSEELTAVIEKILTNVVKKNFSSISNPKKVVLNAIDEGLGYSFISVFMRDSDLEEIMVNGLRKNVFVFHRKFGMCKTNVVINQEIELERFLQKIAFYSGRKFDANNPLLDAKLPDGSRANATNGFASPNGLTLTVRKFLPLPFSIVSLIEKGTLTSESAAFLWVMIEGINISPMNLIISGGTGSGKTTTLNVLTSFIRFDERIISIEDTLELNLYGRENWVQLEAKPPTKNIEELTMNHLLKNALRMRPDRLIVGEVRGKEAKTLFTAMDTGHEGCMGTVHANDSRELLLRLKSPPMSVPESMLPLLELIVIQRRFYRKGVGVSRRIAQIAEVSRMEENVLLSNLFEWDFQKDVLVRTNVPSGIIEKLATAAGLTKKDLFQEITVRQRIIDWMQENKIKTAEEVERVIQQYYLNPKEILQKIVDQDHEIM